MSIRHYRSGDESAQVAIFNAAAAALPKFKPATVPEIQRRVRNRDFDPTTHFYAEDGGKVVGYALFHTNGRLNHPWCLPGHERWAEPLFQAVLDAMRARSLPTAFAAYRQDWEPVLAFFRDHGFAQAREIVNFFVNFFDLPTPSAHIRGITPLTPADASELLTLIPGFVQARTAADLERYLFKNPHYPPESLFALRSKVDNKLLAAGLLVLDVTYANPEVIDSFAPCFRTGAFGTEQMQTKRINGLFSFVACQDRSLRAVGLEMLGYATQRVGDDDTVSGLAAQVSSDAPGLVDFYRTYFRRQGSFPIFERSLAP